MTSKKKRYLAIALFLGFLGTSVQGAYQYGDAGNEILSIQKKLIAAGYKARETSEYDANTKWAVRLFQKDNGLTVDGILGAETYKKLMGKPLPMVTKTVSKKKVISEKYAVVLARANSSRQEESPAITSTLKHKLSKTSAPGGLTFKKKGKTYKGLEIGHQPVSGNVKEVLTYAHTFTGVPYKFGGTTPEGFDCSGYIRHVFKKIGYDMPRQADEQFRVGKKVEKSNLQPGDLVFFETYEPGISHSGIYIGDGQFISATSSSGVAVADIDDSYWGPRYVGAKRVL